MRLEPALVRSALCSALLIASPAWAATDRSTEQEPVCDVVTDVLRQQGLDPTLATEFANRIADRLAGGAGIPVLTERESSSMDKGEWNDVLAAYVKIQSQVEAEQRLSAGREKAYPENVANLVVEESADAARLVILKHLKEIENSGEMSEMIATDRYWSQVFVDQGYGDAYEASRDLLKKALRAGLRPYKEGKGLNAKVFARLASEAIEPPTSLASATGSFPKP